jgi:tRNA(Arg) A34 adenosine deaminase TadA
MSKNNQPFMQEALRLSLEMMRAGKGGPFGAVVVKDGHIIGRGCNQVTSTNDPTAHAEIVAIRDACRQLGSFRLDGCELYASCEPCPMCLSAIYWARIAKIFYSATRKDAAAAGFRDDFIYDEIPLAPSQRKVPSEQLLPEGALAAFAEWKANPDKTPY